MQFIKKYTGNPAFALAALLALAFSFGCNFGPWESGRKTIFTERQNWQELTKSRLVSDEMFYTSDRGDISPVLINVLPLSESILSPARAMWPDNKRFADTLAGWSAKGKAVVLVGLYTRDLKKDDLIKEKRFELFLESAGQRLAPAELAIADKKFLADYFPVFNHWEIVLAASFTADWNQVSTLAVQWPTGVRQLDLTGSISGASLSQNSSRELTRE
jgi:hypothetical protein